jgi:Delta7-sterol 5-desaturase
VIYFVCGTLSFVFVFDKDMLKHPRYLKGQIAMEIRQSLNAFPGIAILTVPFFLAEVRGYSLIYDRAEDAPFYWWNVRFQNRDWSLVQLSLLSLAF